MIQNSNDLLDKFNPEDYKVDDVKLESNPLVIYHAKCTDGFSAAWVFHHVATKFTEDQLQQLNLVGDFDFHPGIYNEDPPDVSDRVVYLVDFSYKRPVVRDMIEIGGARKVILIDHHKTAIEDLSGLPDYFHHEEYTRVLELGESKSVSEDWENPFEMYTHLEMSGATLAWKYWVDQGVLRSEDRPLLLGHIEDRDLWKFKLPMTREIQANVFSYEYTFENWDRLMASSSSDLIKLAAAGEAIERKHHKDIAELVSVCCREIFWNEWFPEPFRDPWRELEIPIASLPYTLASDAGHLMAKNHKNGKWFAACYYDTADHRIFSLRSTEEGIDVSEVAKFYGGGGHKHAAGFKVARNHWLAQI